MKKSIFLISLLLLPFTAFSDTVGERAEAYIGEYSAIAVREMARSGVPASITLAQGLLESSYGQSMLATEANNHFGVKCHSDWAGPSISMDDDQKGECFRKYAAAEDSFRDHSDFLRYKSRYAFLFDYQPDDYKSWAYGLKKAGYATDPEYATKLIRLVETYDLGRFDHSAPVVETAEGVEVQTSVALQVPQSPTILAQPERSVTQGRLGTYAVSLEREILKMNGVPFVYAREGETYRTIALSFNLFARELASFNDRKDSDRRLSAGEPVYLARKARYAAKGLEKHICSEGETMLDISQKYAIRLKSLMSLNGVNDNDRSMREDETLILRPVKD